MKMDKDELQELKAVVMHHAERDKFESFPHEKLTKDSASAKCQSKSRLNEPLDPDYDDIQLANSRHNNEESGVSRKSYSKKQTADETPTFKRPVSSSVSDRSHVPPTEALSRGGEPGAPG